MAQGRVQVRDLEAPEKLMVAPVQSSTYAPPGPVPNVSENYEKLASALGQFGSVIGHMAAKEKAERDKAAKEAEMLKWQHYLASTSNPEQLAAIHSGEIPYWHNPLIAKDAQTYWGGKAAERVAADADKDIQEGKVALGDDNRFNPSEYLREKAKDIIPRVGSSPYAMAAFNRGMKEIEQRLVRDHQKVRGETWKSQALNSYTDRLDGLLDTAKTLGTTDELQSVVKSISDLKRGYGPAQNRGVYGFTYQELDEHTLKVLTDKADDVNYHGVIRGLINADREDLDAQGKKIPSMARTAALRTKIDALEEKMRVAAVRHNKTVIENGMTERAADLFLRGDQSLSRITDQEMQVPGGRPGETVKKTAEKLAEEGALKAMERIRTEVRDPVKAFDMEANLFSKNDLKHPVWFREMENARIAGMSPTEMGSPTMPSQADTIEKGARTFNDLIARGGYDYVKKHLDGKSVAFFEAYNSLRKDAGMSPVQAAAAIAKMEAENKQDPGVLKGTYDVVDQQVKTTLKDDKWGPFNDYSINAQNVRNHVTDLAVIYVRTRGIDPETAVKEAGKVIRERGFHYRNQFIIGAQNFKPEDVPVMDAVLDEKFKLYRPYFEARGINSAKDLAVGPDNKGRLHVIDRRTGFPVTVLERMDAEGNELREVVVPVTPYEFAYQRKQWEAKGRPLLQSQKDWMNERKDRLANPNDPMHSIRMKGVRGAAEEHRNRMSIPVTEEEMK